jgi:heme/copper-type cytochrome/quinol oxidase subunit 1
VSSLGSMISFFAMFVFFVVIYKTLTDKVTLNGHYWNDGEFFNTTTDVVQVTSLEWTQLSPPTFHTYSELPYLVASKS